MDTIHRRPLAVSAGWIRWSARASAIVLAASWLALVLAEGVRTKFDVPTDLAFQAVALAIVFAGYAIGWRQELVGGVIVIVGTIAFFAVNLVTIMDAPPLAAAWFAAPGILYLLAWYAEKVNGAPIKQP